VQISVLDERELLLLIKPYTTKLTSLSSASDGPILWLIILIFPVTVAQVHQPFVN